MTQFRDWTTSLAPASYRGVAFFVDKDDRTTGRRLVVHEFPLADDPYVEDLGRAANKIKVTAYLVSDTADADLKQVMAACDQGGAAALVLPMERLTAHCKSAKRAYSKDKLGYIAIDMDFVRDGVGGGAFSADLLGRLVEFAADGLAGTVDLPGPLRLAFTAGFEGLNVASFVTDAAAGLLQDFAAGVQSVAALVPMDLVAAPEVFQAIADLYAGAASFVTVGAVGDVFSDRAFVAAGQTVLDAPVVDAVLGVVMTLAAASATPAGTVAALGQLLDFGVDLPAVPLTTPSRVVEAGNQAALVTLVRSVVVTQWAAAVVAVDYTDRRAAIQARADAAEAFQGVLDTLSGAATQPLATALYDLQGKTSAALSRQVANLAPVVTVGAAVAMPALWWANRLYGDAARADELVARNRIKNPAFMPLDFEALVS